ncbi:MAG: hypothetical protein HZA15_05220 [Nitrospirae bacterium]|nr:hypothetical protein [Nitrospirota bacterium]
MLLFTSNNASCISSEASGATTASPDAAILFVPIIGEVVDIDLKSNFLTVLEKCTREYFTVSTNQGTSFKKGKEVIALRDIKVGDKAIFQHKQINNTSVALTVNVMAEYTPTTCAATPEVIGHECIAALEATMDGGFHTEDIITIQTDQGQKELILLISSFAGSGNGSLVALLRRPNGCDIVLSTDGRGIKAKFKKGSIYPSLYTYYSKGADEETGAMLVKDVTYYWNGNQYEDVTFKKRMAKGKTLNQKALQLSRQGRIEDAIRIWQQIEKEPDITNAEVLNNLGFSYYTLGKKTKDTKHYSDDPMDTKPTNFTHYDLAYFYLQSALEKDPLRWQALLNMGDLEYEENDFIWALKRYNNLLKLKPDYKHSDVIKRRIEELKRQPEEISAEVVVTKYRSGEKDITYTRLDNKNILRQGYYKSGKLRFREKIVDGYENGEYSSWFENGQLSVAGQNRMGKGLGKYIYYKPDGRISQVLVFKEDGTSVDVTKEYVK